MDCDRTFVALTRGPFPSGDPSDAAVQRHLQQCDSCRAMAEALRPAADLFRESLPPAEAAGLPAYREVYSAPQAQAAGVRARQRPVAASLLSAHEARGGSATHVARPPHGQPPREEPIRRHGSRPTRLVGFVPRYRSVVGDCLRALLFLSLVTAAACGLSWFFG